VVVRLAWPAKYGTAAVSGVEEAISDSRACRRRWGAIHPRALRRQPQGLLEIAHREDRVVECVRLLREVHQHLARLLGEGQHATAAPLVDALADGERLGLKNLSETQRIGLAMLRHGDYLDNTRYRQATGQDSRVATRELGELVDRRLIEQVGTRRWATYRLATGGTQRRDRRAEIISLLRRRGELSRSQIAEALEISNGAVRQWLSKLRREGHIEPTAAARSPSVKYRVAKTKKRPSR
jgi:DNA-binding transcriptional ArsR family regulator